MADTIKVFVTYSRRDEEYLGDNSLLGYLKGLEQEGVEFWTDRKIRTGEGWDAVIKTNLQSSPIALVLVSQAFLDSAYCLDVEIKSLLENKAHLIPVILSPCEWRRHEWLSSRQFLPGGGETVEGHHTDLGKRKGLFLNIREELRERISIIRRMTDTSPALAHYYQGCIERWCGARYAVDKRFVHLTLLLDQGEEAQGPRWAAQGGRKFRDLDEVLREVPDQALVLLGPPGSGKSTLLRRLELDNARALLEHGSACNLGRARVTFFIPLNAYKASGAGEPAPIPGDWLAERWAAGYPDLPPMETLLREKRLTLLLDALNEIPYPGDEPVRQWKDFLQGLVRDFPGNRVVFSCRSLDYSAPLSSKDLPVPQVRIEPLSDAQVERFVGLYCPEHGPEIWRNLKGSRQLELLRSPYYLRLLVEQSSKGEIPAGRAGLFTGFVRQALRREINADNPLFRPNDFLKERDRQRLIQARNWRTPHELPSRGILIDRLGRLAYEMQTRGTEQEASQLRIPYDDALELLDHERAEDILKAGEALGVLEEDLGRDEVLYVHQLLQEYFAARRFAAAPKPELVGAEWHVGRVTPSLEETLARIADSDPLPLLPTTGWEETMALAAAMAEDPDRIIADLMEVNLALAGRCAAQPDVAIAKDLERELKSALIRRTEDTKADLRTRIAAGLALGQLGDPRLVHGKGPDREYLLPPLTDIPGGRYPIGSEEGLYDREGPAHTVDLEPFLIGRFPVTNAEWAMFMKAGGYEDERWWVTEEAKAWRRGEGTAEGPKRQWREDREKLQKNFTQVRVWQQEGRITSKQADDWEAIARMDEAEFEALLDEWYPPGRKTEPDSWNDDVFNSPAQPVVGITWFEARAYCAWLAAQAGRPFRLPTEAEWEAAARGKGGRRYAYGDGFDAGLCNTFETHIRHTTPVGVFPGGETPEGLVDMTGNTWDWTGSLYRPYHYDAKDGREDPVTGEGRRVVRGGSWSNFQQLVRAAYRDYSAPYVRNSLLGVRLACSSPI
ncbi:MAG: SUMF1/EgtB/PvdO family nonheme iron enzyme [Deltaproteobacteria bacterium]|nr:SUMF1/EgtB/PvdO family nonheme iron enzyme [Deltaproteobacteria bacterium]